MQFKFRFRAILPVATCGLVFMGSAFSTKASASVRIEAACARSLAGVETAGTSVADQSWIAPGPIRELFRAMSSAKDRSSIHPDKILLDEIDKLPAGTIVYLDTSKIRTPALKTPSPQSIRFKIKDSMPNRLQIYNPRYGLVEFGPDNISDLYGNLYKIKNFKKRSIFLPGEFVQLGWPGWQRPSEDLQLINLRTGETDSIEKASLPWVAKFIRVLNPEEYEVEFPRVSGRSRRFKVARDQIFQVNTGSGKTLKAILETLSNSTPQFSLGERVRFRGAGGHMRSGLIQGVRENGFSIRHGDELIALPANDIFKSWSPGTPASLRMNVSEYFPETRDRIDLGPPSGLFREVLDGAARFSSTVSFLNAPFEDQLRMLVIFEQILLPWRRAGNTLEATGLRSFSEILCSGAGVCRHTTPLMAALLSEAGLRVRVYFRIMNDTEFETSGIEFRGHTWLEVDSPEGRTFVVDPSEPTVKSFDRVRGTALSDPKSGDARWWSHPQRQQLRFSELN